MNIGRISRCNYGFSYNGYFNPKIHTEDEKIWDNVTERLRAPKMDWIVKRVWTHRFFYRILHVANVSKTLGYPCSTSPAYNNWMYRNVPLPRRHIWRHIQASNLDLCIWKRKRKEGSTWISPYQTNYDQSTNPSFTTDVCELCVIDCYLPIASSTTSTSTYRSAALVLDQSLDREAILRFFYSLPKVTNRKREIYRQLDIDIVMSPRGQDLFFDVRFEGKSLKTVSTVNDVSFRTELILCVM